MTKLYKMELYITEYNGEHMPIPDILEDIGDQYGVFAEAFNIQEVDIKWHDELDINLKSATVDTFRKYFEEKKI